MAEYFGEDLILHELLAVGGMGEVYRATQVGVGGFEKSVAVKRILPGYSLQPQFTEMFLRETNLAAKMQHPNIVQVYRNGRVDDFLYLVMELVKGQTADALIEKAESLGQDIPLGICCFVAAEAAKALDYAHNFTDEDGSKLNIVHRDISPSNIMLSYVGEVKLVDFGLAKAANTDKLTQTGELKGKAAYLAPELLEGKEATPRTDLFTLGIVLYEMVTGFRLFDSDNTFQTLRLVAECVIPNPRRYRPDLDPELERIMLRLLERDPRSRYAAAADLYRDLVGYMGRAFSGFLGTDLATYLRVQFKQEIAETQRKRQEGSYAKLEAKKPPSKPSVKFSFGSGATLAMAKRFMKAQVLVVLLLLLGNIGIISYYLKNRRPDSRIIELPPELAQHNSGFVPTLAERIKDGAERNLTLPKIAEPREPNTIPGLLGWFRADAVNVTRDGTVSEWDDAGVRSFVLRQTNRSAQPVFLKSAINGRPALAFDGQNRALESAVMAKAVRGLHGLTAIFVARVQESRAQYLLAIQHANKFDDVIRVGYAPNGNILRARVDKKFYEVGQTIAGFGVYSSVFGDNQLSLAYNGALRLSTSYPNVTRFVNSAYFSVGMEWDPTGPTDFFNGEIAEIVLFERALEPHERESVEQYLSEKYQIPLNK